MDEHANKRRISATLHRVGAGTSHELTVPGIVTGTSLWLAAWAATGQPDWMLRLLEAIAASVTLTMVFVIQHTQHRIEVATQLKLDELVRATPRADETLIKAEAGGDEELERRSAHNLRDREAIHRQ